MNNTQTLINYVDSLIRENKVADRDGYYLDADKLHVSDREDFAAHLIEYDSCNKEGWDFLLDDEYREDLARTFSAYMLAYGSNRDELKDAFLEGMKECSTKAYQKRMQILIDQRIADVYREDEYERKHPCDADDWDYQEARA